MGSGLRTKLRSRGFTMAEIVMVASILAILAAVALPVAKFSIKRSKEAELRYHLRTMRSAIDEYKRFTDAGLLPPELGADGYPAELEDLVEPLDLVGQIDKQIRLLRRIPVDPMTGEAEWGTRSWQNEWDAKSRAGENVFDVYSLSEGTGMNGIPYSEW